MKKKKPINSDRIDFISLAAICFAILCIATAIVIWIYKFIHSLELSTLHGIILFIAIGIVSNIITSIVVRRRPK